MSTQIKCPDNDSLLLLVEGNLPAAVLADLELHVLNCDDCAKTIDRLCIDETLIAELKENATTPLRIDPRADSLIQQLRQKAAANELTGQFSVGDTAAPKSPTMSPLPVANSTSGLDVEFQLLAPPQASDEIGRLGPYRVLQVLGKGGMGVVFKAEDSHLGRMCALKTMLPAMASRPEMKKRFLLEARAAAQLEHDNIIPIYQVAEDRGVPFIAMPILKGGLAGGFSQAEEQGRQAFAPVAAANP